MASAKKKTQSKENLTELGLVCLVAYYNTEPGKREDPYFDAWSRHKANIHGTKNEVST